MATSIRTFTVEPEGVGRRDYSQDLQYSTIKYERSYQIPNIYWLTVPNIPSLPPPAVWTLVYTFLLPDGTLAGNAPEHKTWFFNIRTATDRNALLFASFARWTNITELLAALPPVEIFRTRWGYGIIDMDFTKGVRTIEGCAYALLFNELVGPVFNWRMNTTCMRERIPEE